MNASRKLSKAILRNLPTADLLAELEARGWLRDALPFAAADAQTLMIEPLPDARLRARVLAATPPRKPLPS